MLIINEKSIINIIIEYLLKNIIIEYTYIYNKLIGVFDPYDNYPMTIIIIIRDWIRV